MLDNTQAVGGAAELDVTALGLAILADGMGGYNAGEVASSMATSASLARKTLYSVS